MNVSVSGSRGYVGGVLLPALEKSGHTVTSQEAERDALIHLYALTNLYECEIDYRRSLSMNVMVTAQACSLMDGKRMIYLSSNTANDSWGHIRSVYDKHKRICEEIIQSCPGLDYVILRLDTVYGYSPNESREGRGIINKWIRTALSGGEITVYNGVINKMRDYVHVDDVASAIISALDAPSGLYDVSSGIRRSVFNAAMTIRETAGGTMRVIQDPDGVHPIDYRSLDKPNLRWLPGWSPAIRFERGVSMTAERYRCASV